jgi:hypothetical protein
MEATTRISTSGFGELLQQQRQRRQRRAVRQAVRAMLGKAAGGFAAGQTGCAPLCSAAWSFGVGRGQ